MTGQQTWKHRRKGQEMDEIQQKALELVNKYRAKVNLHQLTKFPKGKIGNKRCCPVANAMDPPPIKIGVAVHGQFIEFIDERQAELAHEIFGTAYYSRRSETGLWRNSTKVYLPIELRQFVSKVDGCQYPELLEKN